MEENKENQGIHTFIISVIMFFTTEIITCGACYLKGMDVTAMISNTVLVGLGIGTVLFLMAQSKDSFLFDYDNREHYGRFFVFYILSLCLTVASTLLPIEGWPFLVIFVSLSLFSNTLIGVTASTLLLFITVQLSSAGVVAFMLYFLCGLLGACLFRQLDENYRIGGPMICSILSLIICETAGVVLYANEKLSIGLFIIPFMNVIVSTILLIIILKFFSSLVIYKYRDKYMEINDPEFPLLVEFKQCFKEEYYQAVHTSYFCDRVAKKLMLDSEVARAGGYYHRIGKLRGDNSWETVEDACIEYDFPPATRKVLKEYLDKNTQIVEKETAVLLFSDAVISSILFLFTKQPDAELDYNQIIDTVFRKKMESGSLKECKITLQEITVMKNIFKEEKLYYDFLR